MSADVIERYIPEKYQFVKRLTRGGYGQVVLCFVRDSQEEVAIKVPYFKQNTDREIALMRRLMAEGMDQKNFVKFIESFPTPMGNAMVFEKLDMSMWQYCQKFDLSLSEVSCVLQQVATALSVLKDWSIVHADLSLPNVMVVNAIQNPLQVKLIDFGMSRLASRTQRGVVLQHVNYRPPEIILNCPWGEPLDVWNLGVIMAHMMLGYDLFPNTNQYETLKVMDKLLEKPSLYFLNQGRRTKHYYNFIDNEWKLKSANEMKNLETCDYSSYQTEAFNSLHELVKQHFVHKSQKAQDVEAAIDLLEEMLKMDADERITPKAILVHPFIQKLGENLFMDISGENADNSTKQLHLDTEDECTSLTQNEVAKILPEGYEVTKMLGNGQFGQMVLVKPTGSVKCVTLKIPHSNNRTQREVRLLQKIAEADMDHKNLVRFLETWDTSCGQVIVMEEFRMGLLEVMEIESPLAFAQIRYIVRHMAEALKALESRGIIHTGVMAENIWVCGVDRPIFKLAGFGAVVRRKKAEPGMNVQHVSHRAPEIILGLPFNPAIDVWSLGCLLVRMLIRIDLFPSKTEYETLRTMVKLFGQPSDAVLDEGVKVNNYFIKDKEHWKLKSIAEYKDFARILSAVIQTYETEKYDSVDALVESCLSIKENYQQSELVGCINLIKQMLHMDPAQRITPAQILKHPFIHTKNETDKPVTELTADPIPHCSSQTPRILSVKPATAKNIVDFQDDDRQKKRQKNEADKLVSVKKDDLILQSPSKSPKVILVKPAAPENIIHLEKEDPPRKSQKIKTAKPIPEEKADLVQKSPRKTPMVILVKAAAAENTIQDHKPKTSAENQAAEKPKMDVQNPKKKKTRTVTPEVPSVLALRKIQQNCGTSEGCGTSEKLGDLQMSHSFKWKHLLQKTMQQDQTTLQPSLGATTPKKKRNFVQKSLSWLRGFFCLRGDVED